MLLRLGAEFELRVARNQLRALGVCLPPRIAMQGAGTLTGRELEIARAVARRLSNKEIGALLDISARTVSTHLSNIFVKLQVDSRGALADHVREHPLLGEQRDQRAGRQPAPARTPADICCSAQRDLRSRGRALRIGQMTYQGVTDDVERRNPEFD